MGVRQLLEKLRGFPKGLLEPFRRHDGKGIGLRDALTTRRTYDVALAAFLFWGLTSVIVDFLDPLGIIHTLHAYSETVVDRFAAPFYGSPAQDRIAVVLIDEDTLRDREMPWPPRYTYYEEVVRRLLRHKPKAIFLDILLEERRDYDNSLPDALAALKDDMAATTIPVIFSQSEPGRPTLFGGIAGVEAAVAGWSHTSGDYPLLVAPGHTLGDAAHPPSGHDAHGCDPEHGVEPVAVRLYRLACQEGGPGCAEPASLLAGHELCRPMVVHWGRAVSPVMGTHDLLPLDSCDLTDPSPSNRIKAALAAGWASLRSGFSHDAVEHARQPCPYTVTIKEHDLADPRIAGVLEGRIVMVGTSLTGIHDVVTSPVHGLVPGVYLHAMALDNLMTWGRDHYSRSHGMLAVIVVLGAVTALIVSIVLRMRPPRMALWLRLLALFTVLVPGGLLYFWGHQPPLDWLGLLLLFEMIMHLMHQSHQHDHAGGHDAPSSPPAINTTSQGGPL